MLRSCLVALLLVFALPWTASAADPAVDANHLVIETASGQRLPFTVELALTAAEQQKGLMNRASMDPGAGMLFVFEGESIRRFWMKNTLIPLDMLFIAGDGRIVNIAPNTVPESLDTVPSTGPAHAVLEINGGVSALLGIKAGDRVVHPAFGNAPAS